jgi:hypothetical protein
MTRGPLRAGRSTAGMRQKRAAQTPGRSPCALGDHGFAESDIDEAAEAILPSVPASNPREARVEDLRALLAAARAGLDPANLTGQLPLAHTLRCVVLRPV